MAACAVQPAGRVRAPTAEPRQAAHYSTEIPPAPSPAGSDAISRTIAQLGQQAGLVHDPRLSEVAQRLLLPGPPRAPEASVLDALMREHGLVEPVPVASAASGPEAAVVQFLEQEARQSLRSGTATHYGVAVRSGPRGAAALLLLSTRRLELAPVPRSVAQGATLQLRGRLAPGWRAPGWVVTPPHGDVQRLPVADDGPGFAVDVPLDAPGRYRIELVAEGPGGVAVVANFPVWCDQSPPAVALGPSVSPQPPQNLAAVEARLVERIQRERERAGKPALQRESSLDAVALAHTRDMVEHDFVAHESPRTGGPADRIRAAGLSAWLVRENLGRGYSADEIHQGLMDSPGHRDNMLADDAHSLGLAVLAVPEGERTAYVATQIFASLARPVDVREAQRQAVDILARAREQAGLRKAPEDTSLSREAQRAAERYFEAGIDQRSLLQQAMGRAPLPRGSEQVQASMVLVPSIGQLEGTELGLQPNARRLGVGVAQGQRPDGPPHQLAVVVLVAL